MIPHSNHLSGLFDCIIWVQVSGVGGDGTVFFSLYIYIGLDLASTVYSPKLSGISRPPPPPPKKKIKIKKKNLQTRKINPNSWPLETTLKCIEMTPFMMTSKNIHKIIPQKIFIILKKNTKYWISKYWTKKIVHAFVCIKNTEYPPPRPGVWYLLKLWIASQN